MEERVELTRSVTIESNFDWHLTVGDKELLPSSHPLEGRVPSRISSLSDVKMVVEFVDSCVTCIGNPDDKYSVLVSARKGIFMDASGTRVSYMIYWRWGGGGGLSTFI